MKFLILLTLCLAALAAACGDDDDGGEDFDLSYETYEPARTAYITGFTEGWVKFPNLEIWEQPECNYDSVLGNVLHGTEVRVLQKKTGCPFVEYEVELISGDQTGRVGWIRERYLAFDEPPPTGPVEPPEDEE
jgi:hypothetical protein